MVREMASEQDEKGIDGTQVSSAKSDEDSLGSEPIEEAEKNLSRHSTSDSRPPLGEQERTSADTEAQRSAREIRKED